MGEWFSIEVQNGAGSAGGWLDAHGDQLVNLAFGSGATDWNWVREPWGVVVELEFAEESEFERFRQHPGVIAAIDDVPDPVNGVFVHRGRGGSSGSRWPNRPRPLRGSGAAAVPLPIDDDPIESPERRIATVVGGPSASPALMRSA